MATAETVSQHRRAEKPTPRLQAPPVDVYENAEEYLVVADLPGVTHDDLHIELDRGELRIEATRQVGNESKPIVYRRTFTVPDGVSADNVRAELSNGTVQIHLPKAPDVKPRRIPIH